MICFSLHQIWHFSQTTLSQDIYNCLQIWQIEWFHELIAYTLLNLTYLHPIAAFMLLTRWEYIHSQDSTHLFLPRYYYCPNSIYYESFLEHGISYHLKADLDQHIIMGSTQFGQIILVVLACLNVILVLERQSVSRRIW